MSKRQKADETHAMLNERKSSKRKVSDNNASIIKRNTDHQLSGWEEVEAIGKPANETGKLGFRDSHIFLFHAQTNPLPRHMTDQTIYQEKEKPSKHAKKRLKEEKERAIRDAERRRQIGDTAPTTPAEYEQHLLSSPNSSFIWIKYMAFLISLGEIDNTRAIAERAIQTINFREETEKFNVWVAWLNTENLYGDEESTLKLLNRALLHTDSRKMYLAAVDIFDRTDKVNLVEQCIKAMCRKFGSVPDVWLRAIKYRLTQDDIDGANKTLQRAMQSLPRHEHVVMASQTALLEFRMGHTERGRSMFENILQNYPKRLDLWSVYIDQEIAHGGGDAGRVRGLFERATHLVLPAKKMKFLFKRYLEYEKKHGDESTVQHVKKRAMEFVERMSMGMDAGGSNE